MLSDCKSLSLSGLDSSADSLPALTAEAYERRIQRLEQEKTELSRKFQGLFLKLPKNFLLRGFPGEVGRR